MYIYVHDDCVVVLVTEVSNKLFLIYYGDMKRYECMNISCFIVFLKQQ